MQSAQVENFVNHLAEVWASGESERFREVWHADGVLHHVLLDRELRGADIPALHRLQLAAAPDLCWILLDWIWRADKVVVEFRNTWTMPSGRRFEWRGVDVMRIRDGKIAEERVYADTATLRAAHAGREVSALMRIQEIR